MTPEINAAEVLNRGMECLLEKMGVVDAERFVFLIKTENFDYTEWQKDYFGKKTKEQIDQEMEDFFPNPNARALGGDLAAEDSAPGTTGIV